MAYRIEPHRLPDRIIGKLLFLPACLRLFTRMLRAGGRTELWLGDSHIMTHNRKITNSMFMCAPEGQLIVRHGPRLMFTVARKGFGEQINRVGAVLHRFGRPNAFLPVFSAGDVDIRVHLTDRPDATFEFVAQYVDRCAQFAHLIKSDRFAVLLPPPPIDVKEETWFPIVGTLEQRLVNFHKLRAALVEAVDAVPNATLIDLTDLLTGPDGGMREEWTTDGAHATLAVRHLIRGYIREHRLLSREG